MRMQDEQSVSLLIVHLLKTQWHWHWLAKCSEENSIWPETCCLGASRQGVTHNQSYSKFSASSPWHPQLCPPTLKLTSDRMKTCYDRLEDCVGHHEGDRLKMMVIQLDWLHLIRELLRTTLSREQRGLWERNHHGIRATRKEGKTNHGHRKHSPCRKKTNGGSSVGYSGRATLRS
jgi:hypothetical protein